MSHPPANRHAGSPFDHVAEGLYIGSARAADAANRLRRAGITHVLKLYAGSPFFPGDLVVLENALPDKQFVPADVVWRGVDFVLDHLNAGSRVLVVCTMGVSRSSTFVLAALLSRGWDLRTAFVRLCEAHPAARPHPKMWQSLLVHYDVPYTLKQVFAWNRHMPH
ncbi:MAG: dual specificity protein phosphatase family protein [Anaerolineae bacterium]|nr:dual specificity protein phosphatase family protein [Anaerolineae bacterium]